MKRRRVLLLKQKHLKIITAVGACLVVLAVIFIILSLTGRETRRQESVRALADTGIINIGLRDNLLNLCTYNEETGLFEGFEPDVAAEIMRRIFGDDIIVNYIEVTTATRRAYLRYADIDMAFGAAVDIGESGISYTQPYFEEGSAFLVMQDKITAMSQLSGGTIAVVQGTMHAQPGIEDEDITRMDEYLRVLEIEAGVKVYASYPEAVAALRAGHVDAVCASETNLKLFGITGMLILPERFMPNGYCVAVRDSLGAFAEVVDRTIAQMREDGTLDELADKWNLINFEELTEES